MDVAVECRGETLWVRVRERACLRRPEWSKLPEMDREGVALIVLDLDEVEFVSSRFLQGCVELADEVRGSGRGLVLANLPAAPRRLLSLIDGGERLVVVNGEAEVEAHLLEVLESRRSDSDGTEVGPTEKRMLWS